jgi:catechol 2,3-dioxygenase-like lactoylglutathione lyase family enzyme
MPNVVGVDHLSLRVSDLAVSKAFYGRLMPFLGFEVLAEEPGAIGWTNGKTRLWIGQSEAGRRKSHQIGDVGFHHYAFQLESRADVDALEAFVRDVLEAQIVDPAEEYYEDYYAVFFLDPDGLKLEGMKYGERAAAKAGESG